MLTVTGFLNCLWVTLVRVEMETGCAAAVEYWPSSWSQSARCIFKTRHLCDGWGLPDELQDYNLCMHSVRALLTGGAARSKGVGRLGNLYCSFDFSPLLLLIE